VEPLNSAKTIPELVGGLHDAVLIRLDWMAGQRRLELEVEDLYSNFEGLPNDPGRCPGTIALVGVARLRLDLEPTERGLMVYDVSLVRSESGHMDVTITFSPAGRITAQCSDVEWLEARAQAAGLPPADASIAGTPGKEGPL
jgi:hypothetical protein